MLLPVALLLFIDSEATKQQPKTAEEEIVSDNKPRPTIVKQILSTYGIDSEVDVEAESSYSCSLYSLFR